MSRPGVLLLACYEMGHQPLSLAWPLAFMAQAGLPVATVDLSVSPFPEALVAQARFVAIAAPMHTALRLGVTAARRVRAANPNAHLCFYGLYAWLNRDYLLGGPADSVLAGEYEPDLLAQARAALAGERQAAAAAPVLRRLPFPVPHRHTLPQLDHYARYQDNGRLALAGYVEASRGCLHTCRHCPVVPVYGGRFFVVPLETVLADVRQQVAAGAEHVTFGDPDFLNGPGHALKVARALHGELPQVSFDFTAKVEHLLQHRRLLPELRRLGASFVVSAFESVADHLLARLNKGHTAADLDRALDALAAAGLPVQPTWLPFTPWTTLDDYLALLAWIRSRHLVAHVPPVQLAIRLLVPPDSALLDGEAAAWAGELDSANFSYRWRHPDPRMDRLQQQVARLAEDADPQADPRLTFTAIERLAFATAGRPPPTPLPPTPPLPRPPRLTEDWFC